MITYLLALSIGAPGQKGEAGSVGRPGRPGMPGPQGSSGETGNRYVAIIQKLYSGIPLGSEIYSALPS